MIDFHIRFLADANDDPALTGFVTMQPDIKSVHTAELAAFSLVAKTMAHVHDAVAHDPGNPFRQMAKAADIELRLRGITVREM